MLAPARPVSVVGLAGPSAAGKSSLCSALAERARVRVVSIDDCFLPAEQCPAFDMAALPWPTGQVPAAIAARGGADTNAPESIDWDAVHARLSAALACSRESGELVLLDGFLLLSEHAGAARARGMCDRLVCLRLPDGSGEAERRALCRRKYARARPGKLSYEQRGVTEEEYAVYYDGFVWPRWVAHGEERVDAVRREAAGRAGAAEDGADWLLALDCLAPTARLLDDLLATGWLRPDGRDASIE